MAFQEFDLAEGALIARYADLASEDLGDLMVALNNVLPQTAGFQIYANGDSTLFTLACTFQLNSVLPLSGTELPDLISAIVALG